MARRRSTRSRRSPRVRLQGVERVLFIAGATLYLIGLFGGVGLLAMLPSTAMVLLALGGGCQLAVVVLLMF